MSDVRTLQRIRGKPVGQALGGAALAAMVSLALTMPVLAKGNPNAGDVWVDSVGNPSGPGHEMDPHLPCRNINIFGARLADMGGLYQVDSIPPSQPRGEHTVVYRSHWKYNTPKTDSEIISVIDVHLLIANARAAGAAPINRQGYHFKLDVTQDPQKHKTFWVDCPASVGTGATHTGGTGGTGGTHTGGTGGGNGGGVLGISTGGARLASDAAKTPNAGTATTPNTGSAASFGLGSLLGLLGFGALGARRRINGTKQG